MNIGFFLTQDTERETIAVCHYAKYNEDLLKNHSILLCFKQTPTPMKVMELKQRFQVIEINRIEEITQVIERWNLSFFYTLLYGCQDVRFPFDNKMLWGTCKTIKHCMYDTRYPDSDICISTSDRLNQKLLTNRLVIPLIDTQTTEDPKVNLRDELHIPHNATVFGRYGSYTEFNITFAHEAIKEHLDTNEDDYFLFLHTERFYEHPRILYLELNKGQTIDESYLIKFVHTCNALIHARKMGETFGNVLDDFSSRNKPILTCPCGNMKQLKRFGDKLLLYRSKEELVHLFKNLKTFQSLKTDWRTDRLYSPEDVMPLFKTLFTFK
jgi:hypothetical protein